MRTAMLASAAASLRHTDPDRPLIMEPYGGGAGAAVGEKLGAIFFELGFVQIIGLRSALLQCLGQLIFKIMEPVEIQAVAHEDERFELTGCADESGAVAKGFKPMFAGRQGMGFALGSA